MKKCFANTLLLVLCLVDLFFWCWVLCCVSCCFFYKRVSRSWLLSGAYMVELVADDVVMIVGCFEILGVLLLLFCCLYCVLLDVSVHG